MVAAHNTVYFFKEDSMSYEIRDINLAESGEHKIDWVRKNCPLLRSLEADFSKIGRAHV